MIQQENTEFKKIHIASISSYCKSVMLTNKIFAWDKHSQTHHHTLDMRTYTLLNMPREKKQQSDAGADTEIVGRGAEYQAIVRLVRMSRPGGGEFSTSDKTHDQGGRGSFQKIYATKTRHKSRSVVQYTIIECHLFHVVLFIRSNIYTLKELFLIEN